MAVSQLGAIDETLKYSPPNTGSDFHNYNSIVLLAICDAQYSLDIDQYGKWTIFHFIFIFTFKKIV